MIMAIAAPATSLADGGAASAPAAERLFNAIPRERAESLCEHGWVEVDLGHPDGGEFDGMEALVIFDLPKERVLELLAQTERQREYRRDLRGLRPIVHAPDFAVDEHRARVMLIPIEYRVRYRFDRAHTRMRWELDPGSRGSLERLEGFWELHDLGDGRTLAHFGAAVSVSDALPGFIQETATRKRLPADLESTRRWVNARGARAN